MRACTSGNGDLDRNPAAAPDLVVFAPTGRAGIPARHRQAVRGPSAEDRAVLRPFQDSATGRDRGSGASLENLRNQQAVPRAERRRLSTPHRWDYGAASTASRFGTRQVGMLEFAATLMIASASGRVSHPWATRRSVSAMNGRA
jgi:hypothetical protein